LGVTRITWGVNRKTLTLFASNFLLKIYLKSIVLEEERRKRGFGGVTKKEGRGILKIKFYAGCNYLF
jgi:hypothetical protein